MYLTSLVFYNNVKIHLENWNWWDSFKRSTLEKHRLSNMGGSASSQSTGQDGEIKNTDQKNFGLINVSSEDTNLNSWIEIATCAGVIIVVLYILGYLCQKRQQKKLAKFHAALRAVRVEPEAARIPVFPLERAPANPASVPTVQPPPPAYPAAYPSFAKTTAEMRGAEIMSQYA